MSKVKLLKVYRKYDGVLFLPIKSKAGIITLVRLSGENDLIKVEESDFFRTLTVSENELNITDQHLVYELFDIENNKCLMFDCNDNDGVGKCKNTCYKCSFYGWKRKVK